MSNEILPPTHYPADQAWYWEPEWQAGEREADEQIARGEMSEPMTGEEFLAHLEDLAEHPDAWRSRPT